MIRKTRKGITWGFFRSFFAFFALLIPHLSKAEFVLELTSGGGLILIDELTGYWIAIEAFGPDNYQEFRLIFDRARASSSARAELS